MNHYRTIAIEASAPALATAAPQLSGEPAAVQRVIGALQLTLDEQLGRCHPPEAWLRELRLASDEAQLSLAPGLPCCAANLAQAAFDALRSLLPDTDIFVRTAAH